MKLPKTWTLSIPLSWLVLAQDSSCIFAEELWNCWQARDQTNVLVVVAIAMPHRLLSSVTYALFEWSCSASLAFFCRLLRISVKKYLGTAVPVFWSWVNVASKFNVVIG
jgi:hypothetical protein